MAAPDCKWVQVQGDWTINTIPSNREVWTFDADAILRSELQVPGNAAYHKLKVDWDSFENDTEILLMINYLDPNNYIAALYYTTAGRVELIRRERGEDFQIRGQRDVVAFDLEREDIWICRDPDGIVIRLDSDTGGDPADLSTNDVGPELGRYVAVGTRTMGTSEQAFFIEHRPDPVHTRTKSAAASNCDDCLACTECTTTLCNEGSAPGWIVSIDTNVDVLNGDRYFIGGECEVTGGDTRVEWEFDLWDSVESEWWNVGVVLTTVGTDRVEVFLNREGTGISQWSSAITLPTACYDIDTALSQDNNFTGKTINSISIQALPCSMAASLSLNREAKAQWRYDMKKAAAKNDVIHRPCAHMGGKTRDSEVSLCRGRKAWRAVFACEKFGECVPLGCAERIHVCESCKKYEAVA